MGRNTEKREKWVTHTVGPGIWRETLKNVENVKCTIYDLEFVEKTEKRRKWDKHTVGHGI